MPEGFDGVIDISHFEKMVDFDQVYANGVRGVILKATQGRSYVDETFHDRAEAAAKAGLLVGAFHFGERDAPDPQLTNFRTTVKGSKATLFAFDFEPWSEKEPDGEIVEHPAPTIDQAIGFLDGLAAETDGPVLLYGGDAIREALQGRRNGWLARYRLWLSAYKEDPDPYLPAGWPGWTLWQYTDGTKPNRNSTPGVGRPCDRSRFRGTVEQLYNWWPRTVTWRPPTGSLSV